MNFSEVLKKIPTPQVSMPHMPQLPKLNVSTGKEDLGKPPISMTQEDMQQLIHNIGESVLIPEDGAFVALWILTLIRSSPGVQMKWGDDTDVKLVQKWNPLCRSLPYATLTHHPAYSKRDQLPPRQGEVPGAGFEDASNPVALYDVNNFLCALKEACVGTNVQFSSGDIIIESYGNLGSVVFNQTSLGFTKTKVAASTT
ncbi:Tumor protein p63-regulated protein [Paragonimus kellicotti]|nr:Tumor protein p63-regulated protein [Paragonimus kellicotti]